MSYGRTKVVVVPMAAALTLMLALQAARAQIEFGIPTPIPGPINEGGAFAYPWLTTDELTMFYSTTVPGSVGGTDIAYSTRTSIGEPWGAPVFLGESINTDLSETFPSMTADGLELYFQRTSDPFTHADGELFVSRRTTDSEAWGTPEPLPLNSDTRDASPRISDDGLTLYFDSTRPVADPEYDYDFNTWVATRSARSEPFSAPELFHPGLGFVTEDGLTHLFTMGPVGAEKFGVPHNGTWDDIYMRTRDTVSDEFGPIVTLGSPVNSSALDCCVDLGELDATFYFSSARVGAPTDGLFGFVNLWQAPLAQAVSVEVKPGSVPTPINLKSKGVLPVAILSTADFDVSQIDPATLQFGDPLLIADGGSPVDPLRWSYEDVDFDGLDDLALKFSLRDLLDNQVIAATTREGYLAGQLFNGSHIAGRDAVQIVARGHAIPEPSSLLLLVGGIAAVTLRRQLNV